MIPAVSEPLPVKHERYWEIDAIRGACLVFMVLFHAIFVLSVFNIISVEVWEDFFCRDIIPGIKFQYIHLGTSLFVLICGFSLVLRLRRMAGKSKKEYNIAVIKRGIQVFLFGVLVALIASIIIYFFFPDNRFMLFNILMMMGSCMIIALPFVGLKKWAFIPGIIIIALGLFFSTLQGPLWLLPFGILPGDYMPRDYFPILPWLGIMLLGYALGSVLYPNGIRKFTVPKPNKFFSFFVKLGNYPLQIYILHIPALFGIVALIALICALCGCPISPLISFS